MKTRTSIKAGIDTVPLPERPFVGIKDPASIGTWPTPERPTKL